MAMRLEFNIIKFIRTLDATDEMIAKGAKRGLHDALDDWKRESTDIAPLDKGTLRRSISTEIDGKGLELTGEISANAIESGSKGRFNYAYYIHEVKGKIANPTTPGTLAKFLDVPAKKNKEKWLRMIENEIQDEVKRGGW
jgi:hypothetical protein